MNEYFRQKKSIVHEKFGDETVIVNLDTGCYYSLQGSASAIWDISASGQSQAQVVEIIRGAFLGDPSEIASAVVTFLEELVTEHLLDRVETAEPVGSKCPDAATRPFEKPILQKYTDMEELLQLDPIHEIDEMGWPSAKPTAA